MRQNKVGNKPTMHCSNEESQKELKKSSDANREKMTLKNNETKIDRGRSKKEVPVLLEGRRL